MAEEEEEIMAEEQPQEPLSLPFAGVVSLVVSMVERYGWFLIIGGVLAYYLYVKLVKPRLHEYWKQREIAAEKKNENANLAAKMESIQTARDKLQQKYALDAQRQQEILQEKKRKEIYDKAEEWEMHKQGRGYHNRYHADEERAKPATTVTLRAGQKQKQNHSSADNTPAASGDPRDFVQSKVNAYPVVIFSKTWCPFCTHAKQAISAYRLPSEFYQIVELDDFDQQFAIQVQDVLQQLTGQRTVPRVFVGGTCIGGGDETVAMHRSGQLQQMLNDCGALSH